MKTSSIIREVTPLKETDVFYIADREKIEFDYPIHVHSDFELNFVQGGEGITRIVGDSTEIIENYDLVLITGNDLEHVWMQNGHKKNRIREVTIQFNLDFEHDFLLRSNPFKGIKNMIELAKYGLAFPMSAIMEVYSLIDTLSKKTNSVEAVTQLLMILQKLSECQNARVLASESYTQAPTSDDSKIITKVKQFIEDNYSEQIKLKDISSIANMSTSAFCRFFKLHTGFTLVEYITEIRLGHVARMLVETNESIVNISFFCGFNNLSNFNRLFLRKKGCTPTFFRNNYQKATVIV